MKWTKRHNYSLSPDVAPLAHSINLDPILFGYEGRMSQSPLPNAKCRCDLTFLFLVGEQKSAPQLFNYAVNLDKRVRANHPLRQVKELIDFGFVREEVAQCYGKNGNESVGKRSSKFPFSFVTESVTRSD
jgi:hypothetical protein